MKKNLFLILLTSCSLLEEQKEPEIKYSFEEIAPGAECATGGMRVSAGIDKNLNGKLGAKEVKDSYVVCNNFGVYGDVPYTFVGKEGKNKRTASIWVYYDSETFSDVHAILTFSYDGENLVLDDLTRTLGTFELTSEEPHTSIIGNPVDWNIHDYTPPDFITVEISAHGYFADYHKDRFSAEITLLNITDDEIVPGASFEKEFILAEYDNDPGCIDYGSCSVYHGITVPVENFPDKPITLAFRVSQDTDFPIKYSPIIRFK